MSSKKKGLPKAFWFLIALAGMLAVGLVTAIVFEKNPELQKKLDALFGRNQSTPVAAAPNSRPEDRCELIETSELTTITAAGGTSSGASTSVKDADAETLQLQSTYQEGDLLVVEVFLAAPPRARKIPILFNDRFAAHASQAQEDSFFCDVSTASVCRQDPKSDLWTRARGFDSLYDGGGVVQYAKPPAGKDKQETIDFAGIAKDPAGIRLVHNRLGICGEPLGPTTLFTSLKVNSRPWVVAFDPTRGVVAMFDVAQWSSFGPREVPRGADRQFAFVNGRPELFDCRKQVRGDALDSMMGFDNNLLVRVRGRQDLGSRMQVLSWDGENFSNPIWTSDLVKNFTGADEGGWAGPNTLYVHMRDFTGEGQKILLLSTEGAGTPKELGRLDGARRSFVLSLPRYGARAMKPKASTAEDPVASQSHDVIVVEKESSWRNKPAIWMMYANDKEVGGYRTLSLPTPESFQLEETQARVRWMRLPGNRELLLWQGKRGGAVTAATYRCLMSPSVVPPSKESVTSPGSPIGS